MPGIFSRGQSGANAPVIPPKVPTPGPEAPTEVSAEEAALPVTAPVPIVRPSDQEPVGPDLDEAGGGIAVVPRAVLRATGMEAQLAVHPLPPRIAQAKTMLAWRRSQRSSALEALRKELA